MAVVKRAVLGAMDREMAAIKALCEGAGVEVVQAATLGPDGSLTPVGGQTTYQATSPEPQAGDIWVECAPAQGGKSALARAGALLVDHHEPGDFGHGRSPVTAFEASSLGQILALLEVRHRLIAACDHCVTAAFAGLVPGVTREDVLTMRIAGAAAAEGRLPEEILFEVEQALHLLDQAPLVEIGGVWVADLRSQTTVGLHHAGAMTGRAYVTLVREKVSGRLKCVLGADGPGTASEGRAAAGFAVWAGRQGYVDAYGGDPARGFAGAYLPRGSLEILNLTPKAQDTLERTGVRCLEDLLFTPRKVLRHVPGVGKVAIFRGDRYLKEKYGLAAGALAQLNRK